MRYTLLIILSLIGIGALNAQILGLTQFTIDNGLPSNTVYDIVQDEKGFIWLATDNGISRFDGKTFINYTVEDGLPDNEILYFYRDSKDRIWMIAFNGNISYYKDGRFYNDKNTRFLRELAFEEHISHLFEDRKGNIWFYQYKLGVKKLDTSGKVTSYSDLPELYHHNQFNCTKFSETKEGKIVLIHEFVELNEDKKLVNLDQEVNKDIIFVQDFQSRKDWAIKKVDDINQRHWKKHLMHFAIGNAEVKNNAIYKKIRLGSIINKISNGNYFVTNRIQGVNIYNPTEGLSKFKSILPHIKSTRSYEDGEGNVWVGSTTEGVIFLPDQNILGLKNNIDDDLFSIAVHKDKIITGSKSGRIQLIDKNTLLKEREIYESDANVRKINRIKNLNGNTYVLGEKSLIGIDPTDKEGDKTIEQQTLLISKSSTYKDISFAQGVFYIAFSYGVKRTKKNPELKGSLWSEDNFQLISNSRATTIHALSKKCAFIGSTKGLHLFENDSIQKFQTNSDFDNTIITDIDSYKENFLMSSNVVGLAIFTKDTLINYSRKDGLLSSNIKSIHVDHKKNIWLSSNAGLNRLRLNRDHSIESITSYTISDGLYTNDVRSCYVDGEKCYVATGKGINIIDITKDRKGIQPPKIHINDFFLNNKSISLENNLEFEHDQQNVEFGFSGISFKSLGSISFKYRLKGLEKEYISTSTNMVRYSSLPAGKYTFEVIAVAKNNVESAQPATIFFTIKPAFYKSFWFISVVSIFLFGGLGISIARRNKRHEQRKQAEGKIASLRYQALMAQMNPHFIKNMLFSINDQIKKGEHDTASDSMDRFSELINLVLKSTESNLISLSQELRTLQLYIQLQQSRLNNFDYKFDTTAIKESSLKRVHIPPMLLQPLVENSIVHGLMKYTKGTLTLSFKLREDMLHCTIVDTGMVSEKTPKNLQMSTGISVKNIKERLNLINDTKDTDLLSVLPIDDLPPDTSGTVVNIQIPSIIF